MAETESRIASDLYSACAEGRVADVARILDSGPAGVAALSQRITDGSVSWTPVHIAAWRSQLRVLRLLNARGLLPTETGPGSPLDTARAAADAAPGYLLPQAAHALLLAPAEFESGFDRLCRSVSLGNLARVREWLSAPATLCMAAVKDADENTLSHVAAAAGRAEVLTELISRQLYSPAANVRGDTPLHLAAASAELGAVVVIRECTVTTDAPNADGKTPVDLAEGATAPFARGIARYLRDPVKWREMHRNLCTACAGAKAEDFPGWAAAAALAPPTGDDGDASLAEIIKAASTTDICPIIGTQAFTDRTLPPPPPPAPESVMELWPGPSSALAHVADVNGSLPFHHASAAGAAPVVRALVERGGAALAAPGRGGTTPDSLLERAGAPGAALYVLTVARFLAGAHAGSVQRMERALAVAAIAAGTGGAGWLAGVRDFHGHGALHHAAASGSVAAVSWLLAAGFRGSSDHAGHFPADMVRCDGEGDPQGVAAALAADESATHAIFADVRAGRCKALEAALAAAPGLLRRTDANGSNLLHISANEGNLEAAQIVLSAAAAADAATATAAAAAVAAGDYTRAYTLSAQPSIMTILSYANAFGNTPYHVAAGSAPAAMLALLEQHGLATTTTNMNSETPAKIAQQRGARENQLYLEQRVVYDVVDAVRSTLQQQAETHARSTLAALEASAKATLKLRTEHDEALTRVLTEVRELHRTISETAALAPAALLTDLARTRHARRTGPSLDQLDAFVSACEGAADSPVWGIGYLLDSFRCPPICTMADLGPLRRWVMAHDKLIGESINLVRERAVVAAVLAACDRALEFVGSTFYDGTCARPSRRPSRPASRGSTPAPSVVELGTDGGTSVCDDEIRQSADEHCPLTPLHVSSSNNGCDMDVLAANLADQISTVTTAAKGQLELFRRTVTSENELSRHTEAAARAYASATSTIGDMFAPDAATEEAIDVLRGTELRKAIIAEDNGVAMQVFNFDHASFRHLVSGLQATARHVMDLIDIADVTATSSATRVDSARQLLQLVPATPFPLARYEETSTLYQMMRPTIDVRAAARRRAAEEEVMARELAAALAQLPEDCADDQRLACELTAREKAAELAHAAGDAAAEAERANIENLLRDFQADMAEMQKRRPKNFRTALLPLQDFGVADVVDSILGDNIYNAELGLCLFTNVEQIEAGQVGTFRATFTGNGQCVVLKRIAATERATLKELRRVQRERHPNIIQLLDVFKQSTDVGEMIYLVYPYYPSNILDLAGTRASTAISSSVRALPMANTPEENTPTAAPTPAPTATSNTITAADTCTIASTVQLLLSAVSCLHRIGIIHGSIKPDNIFISEDGIPILGDFDAGTSGSAARIAKLLGTSYMDSATAGAEGQKTDEATPGTQPASALGVLGDESAAASAREDAASARDAAAHSLIAPELRTGNFDQTLVTPALDIYALGRAISVLLPPNPTDAVGQSLKALLDRMTCVSPALRPDADECLADPYFELAFSDGHMIDTALSTISREQGRVATLRQSIHEKEGRLRTVQRSVAKTKMCLWNSTEPDEREKQALRLATVTEDMRKLGKVVRDDQKSLADAARAIARAEQSIAASRVLRFPPPWRSHGLNAVPGAMARICLLPGDPAFDAIRVIMDGLTVVGVTRIENPALMKRYLAHRLRSNTCGITSHCDEYDCSSEDVDSDLNSVTDGTTAILFTPPSSTADPDAQREAMTTLTSMGKLQVPNEQYVFFAADPALAALVGMRGFDNRLCITEHTVRMHVGVEQAVAAGKRGSINLVDNEDNALEGSRTLFVARMLVSSAVRGNNGEIALIDGASAYPEYLVWYK